MWAFTPARSSQGCSGTLPDGRPGRSDPDRSDPDPSAPARRPHGRTWNRRRAVAPLNRSGTAPARPGPRTIGEPPPPAPTGVPPASTGLGALIRDVDGTLADTGHLHRAAFNEALARAGGRHVEPLHRARHPVGRRGHGGDRCLAAVGAAPGGRSGRSEATPQARSSRSRHSPSGV
ncbi:MAG: hypothetical protein O9972_27565 [Burkholderiales bacterium]|nr:hypothetical protein [Burkholderiales bacterium]